MGLNRKENGDIDIIDMKFDPVKNGYSTVQVDRFLDLLDKEIEQKNSEINKLKDQNSALSNDLSNLKNVNKDLENELNQLKFKYKNIDPEAFENSTRIRDLKKIDVYEKKLNSLGIDVKDLTKDI